MNKQRFKAFYNSSAGKITEILLFLFLLAAGAALLLRLKPGSPFIPLYCPLNALTGLDCPGCGMTRAVYSLLKGQIGAAFGYNALWPLSLTLLLIFPLLYLIKRLTGKNCIPAFLKSEKFWISMLILYILFGILRNLPFYPFDWLAA